jgi:hypothetical protein
VRETGPDQRHGHGNQEHDPHKTVGDLGKHATCIGEGPDRRQPGRSAHAATVRHRYWQPRRPCLKSRETPQPIGPG